jgi:hypothetical protein
MNKNTTGGENVAVGLQSLQTNTTGSNNTALGVNAMYYNSVGRNNTAIGRDALIANTTASNVVAVGYRALYSSAGAAPTIVAIGSEAAYSYTGSGSNQGQVYVGASAGYTNTAGIDNTFVGGYAGYKATGSYNTALGSGALSLTNGGASGSNNTAIGYTALAANTSSVNNTAVGSGAGGNVTIGQNNVFIGQGAGNTTTAIVSGSQNIHVGVATIASAQNVDYEAVIGFNLTGKGANTGYIGNGGVYQGNNSASWSTTSDRRLKKNIVDNNIGLSKITAIQVRNFEYRLPNEITDLPQTQAVQKSGTQLGVIAQELQAILPECVKEESTCVLSVDSDNLTWFLFNAVKELKAEFDAYKATHP